MIYDREISDLQDLPVPILRDAVVAILDLHRLDMHTEVERRLCEACRSPYPCIATHVVLQHLEVIPPSP